MTSIKWNKQEVKNPAARAFVATVVVLGCFVMLPIGMVVLTVGLGLTMPFHPIFLAFGRRGIFQGNGVVAFDKTSFERLSH